MLGAGCWVRFLDSSYRVTSGAATGRIFFRMAWIQFLLMPDVMADSVHAPSLLWRGRRQSRGEEQQQEE